MSTESFTLYIPAWLLDWCFLVFLNASKESIHFIFGPPELHFIDHCLCQSICRGATVTSEVSVWVLREPVRVWINCCCNLWEGNITPALFCSSSDKTGVGVWVFSRRICSLWKGNGISVCSPRRLLQSDSMRANDSSSTRGRKKSVKVTGPVLLLMWTAGGWGYRLDAERIWRAQGTRNRLAYFGKANHTVCKSQNMERACKCSDSLRQPCRSICKGWCENKPEKHKGLSVKLHLLFCTAPSMKTALCWR